MDYDCIIKAAGRKKIFFITSLCFICLITYATNVQKHALSIAMFQPNFTCRIPKHLLSKADSSNISAYFSFDFCGYKQFYNETLKNCEKFDFDKKQMLATFIMDFNIVCQNKWIRIFLYYLQTVNIPLIFLFGALGDKIGRKIIIIVLMIFHTASNLTIGLAHNLWLNGVLMSLSRMAMLTDLIGLIWILELSPTHYETIVFSLYFILEVFASFIISLVSHLTLQWRLVYLISSGTMVLWLLSLYIPESPRWLIVNNRHKKFHEAVSKIAYIDRTDIPMNLIEDFIEYSHWTDISKFSIRDVWQYRNLRYRICALCFIAFSLNLFQPNFILNVSKLYPENFSLAYMRFTFILALFLIPLLILFYQTKKIVKPCLIIMILTSIFYTICLFFNDDIYSHMVSRLVFLFMAQNLLHAAMVLIYFFTVKLLPTTQRCFSIACVLASAIAGEIFSNVVNQLITLSKPKSMDDSYICVFMYLLVTIVAIVGFYYKMPEPRNIPYGQTSSDSSRIIKGLEDELIIENEDRTIRFNKRNEQSHLMNK